MSTQPLPGALRAAARVRISRILGRSRRVFEYDAKYPGGRVELNVDADVVLQGAGYPADAQTTRLAAEAACPEVGTGPWIEYATAVPIEAADGQPPHSHRKPGPATDQAPAESKSFGHILWNSDPRYVLLQVVRAIFELAYGRHLVEDGDSIWIRLLGAALFAFGLLHAISYVLTFFPKVLERERWSRTWPRRIARAILMYAWVAAAIGWGVARYLWDS